MQNFVEYIEISTLHKSMGTTKILKERQKIRLNFQQKNYQINKNPEN